MLSMKTCFSSVALKWPNFDTCKRASENHPLGATLLMFFIFLVTCSWSTEKVARVLKIRSSKKTSCCNKLHSSRKQTKWKEEHFTWENTCNQASSALMCLPHLRLRLKTWQTDAKLEKNFRASCNVPKLKWNSIFCKTCLVLGYPTTWKNAILPEKTQWKC